MSIRIFTFIQDSSREDDLLAALISGIPSCELIFRATSLSALIEFSKSLEAENAILIHDQSSKDARLIPPRLLEKFAAVDITEISKSGTGIIAHNLARTIREDHLPEKRERKRINKPGLISVSGTTGSPGITTIAINLAREYSERREVDLVDLDHRRADIAHNLGGRNGETLQPSHNLKVWHKLDEANNAKVTISDLGSAPNLENAMGDRRSGGREFLSSLEASSIFLYVIQPESSQLHELEAFLEHLPRSGFSGKIHIVQNKFASSSRSRATYKRARAITNSLPHYLLPLDVLSIERAKEQFSTLLEVSPRSKLRRSLSELADKIEVDIPAI